MWDPLTASNLDSVPKRPSRKPNSHLRSRLKLLGRGLELIHIPVAPKEFALQESGFGACEPKIEARRQRH